MGVGGGGGGIMIREILNSRQLDMHAFHLKFTMSHNANAVM